MFEQTFLPQPASTQKTWALAASFPAQSCVLGVLLLGSLLFTRGMPFVVPELGLPMFLPTPRAPEPPRQVPQSATHASSAPSAPRVFHPVVIRSVPASAIPIVVDDAPVLADESVPRGTPRIGLAEGTSLPPYVAVIPRAEIVRPVVTVPEQPSKPTAISSGVLASKLVTRVLPQYPDLARKTRTSGVVRLLVVVGKDGRVETVRVLEGHPMLRESAVNAVKQWVYSPTYLSGQPIEVEASIEVNFTLN